MGSSNTERERAKAASGPSTVEGGPGIEGLDRTGEPDESAAERALEKIRKSLDTEDDWGEFGKRVEQILDEYSFEVEE